MVTWLFKTCVLLVLLLALMNLPSVQAAHPLNINSNSQDCERQTCERCLEQEYDEPYCDRTGKRRGTVCVIPGAADDEEETVSTHYESCDMEGNNEELIFYVFLGVMLSAFAGSVQLVRKRKLRAQQLQAQRIASMAN
jgi:hypothetical protein